MLHTKMQLTYIYMAYYMLLHMDETMSIIIDDLMTLHGIQIVTYEVHKNIKE